MQDPQGQPVRSSPASSYAVPRAVEFLILFVLRWTFLGLAVGLGLLSTAAYLRGWPWWIVLPLSLLTLACLAAGIVIRPRGKFRFDSIGPAIVVPDVNPTQTRKN